jgi:hypothetical protein
VGGCDGCLNVNDTENGGLAAIVTALEAAYQAANLSTIISRWYPTLQTALFIDEEI